MSESIAQKFEPTPVGLAGRPHPISTELAPSICPECPWRYKMVEGFNVAMPADNSMLVAALTHKVGEYPPNGKEIEGGQGCHMRTELRCRGAEHFRANIGLSSEVTSSGVIMANEHDAIAIWNKRRGLDYYILPERK